LIGTQGGRAQQDVEALADSDLEMLTRPDGNDVICAAGGCEDNGEQAGGPR